MEPNDQKNIRLSENNKRGKLVGKLLVGLFTLSTTVIAMIVSYSEESGKADSPQAIDRFEKALAAYILQGDESRSDVDIMGGLKTSTIWQIEIEQSVFNIRSGMPNGTVGAHAKALDEKQTVLEMAANALRSYKNQSIARGKIFTSVRGERVRILTKDPDFLALSSGEKRKLLLEIDPVFSALSQGEQNKVLATFSGFDPAKPYKILKRGADASSTNEVDWVDVVPSASPSKTDEFGGIIVEDSAVPSKESIEYTTTEYSKNAAMPWNVQSNLALYGKVAAWTLGTGLAAYIAARIFVFIIVLIWWFMIDRIKDISRAIKD